MNSNTCHFNYLFTFHFLLHPFPCCCVCVSFHFISVRFVHMTALWLCCLSVCTSAYFSIIILCLIIVCVFHFHCSRAVQVPRNRVIWCEREIALLSVFLFENAENKIEYEYSMCAKRGGGELQWRVFCIQTFRAMRLQYLQMNSQCIQQQQQLQ